MPHSVSRLTAFGPILLAILLTSAFTADHVSAADWPRFRGPGGSAVSSETGLPAPWSDTNNLKWKTRLPGYGTSSPVVVGNKVIVTCYSGYGMGRGSRGAQGDLRRHVVCVDRNSGKILWAKTVKPHLPEDRAGGFLSSHGYASHTPVTDGQHIYAFMGKTGLLCVNMQGDIVWRKSLGTGSGIRGWGTASSPILYKNTVIVTALPEGNALVALDKTTGKEVWKQQVEGYRGCWATPVIAKSEDGTRDELILNVPHEIWSLNPDTGKLLWYCEGIPQDAIAPSVVVENGIVYATGGRRAESLAVRSGGKGDVTKTHLLWRARVGSYVTSPVVHNGHVYIVSDRGIVSVLNAKDGSTVNRSRLSARGRLYASPLIADGKLYVVTRESGTFVFTAKPDIKQLAHNRFTGDDTAFNASPAVADGNLFLRSNTYLYCVSEADTPQDNPDER